MNLSYKQCSVNLTKELSEDGSFEGYVAVFNNRDFGGDIIDPSAFNAEPVGKSYPLLSDHETKSVIGNYKISIDSYGVKMSPAKFNLMRDEKTGSYMVRKAAEKYANLKNGDISGFSIGYMIDENGCEFKEIDGKRCRIIKKATLMEGSVVTFPMNDKARLTAIKTVNPTTEFPLAPRDREWDASMAEKRIKEFTKSENEPASIYQRYFMYFDAGRSKFFDAYKLPFVDIIDDEPHIVPKAIFAIAAVLKGARAGVNIPEGDKAKVKEILNNIYARMAKEFDDESLVSPFAKKNLEILTSLKDIEAILKDSGFSSKEAKTLISKVKEFSFRDAKDNQEENEEERDDLLNSLVSIKNTINSFCVTQELKSINNLFKKNV